MRWKVHGERPVYENRWVDVWSADVEQPDGQRVDYRAWRAANWKRDGLSMVNRPIRST